jgi:hypothetical protein
MFWKKTSFPVRSQWTVISKTYFSTGEEPHTGEAFMTFVFTLKYFENLPPSVWSNVIFTAAIF